MGLRPSTRAERSPGASATTRIDTPIFEDAALFETGIGETTDIVEKEMYVFEDRGEQKPGPAPGGHARVCRAYLEHGMASQPQPVRL